MEKGKIASIPPPEEYAFSTATWPHTPYTDASSFDLLDSYYTYSGLSSGMFEIFFHFFFFLLQPLTKIQNGSIWMTEKSEPANNWLGDLVPK